MKFVFIFNVLSNTPPGTDAQSVSPYSRSRRGALLKGGLWFPEGYWEAPLWIFNLDGEVDRIFFLIFSSTYFEVFKMNVSQTYWNGWWSLCSFFMFFLILRPAQIRGVSAPIAGAEDGLYSRGGSGSRKLLRSSLMNLQFKWWFIKFIKLTEFNEFNELINLLNSLNSLNSPLPPPQQASPRHQLSGAGGI